MQTLAQRFLNSEEQQQVLQVVRAMERRSSGEIVPMVVSASHSYPEAALTGAVLLAGLLALPTALATGGLFWATHQVLWFFFGYFVLFFPLCRLLMRFPMLLRPFISTHRADEEVRRAALARFYSEGLQATREASGVLVYISVLERRVWILGDCGINQRIAPETWSTFVVTLIAGIKQGQAGAALCAVIEGIGDLLARHFPQKKEDTNELGDLLIADEQGRLSKRTLIVE